MRDLIGILYCVLQYSTGKYTFYTIAVLMYRIHVLYIKEEKITERNHRNQTISRKGPI
jgi:hypothetical protein